MPNYLRPYFFPVLALLLALLAWRSYGVQGLLLAGAVITFWLLLHFTRFMRVMGAAAHRPIGYVGDARGLHRRLRAGLLLMEVVQITRSLGQAHTAPEQEPQQLSWSDEYGYRVNCTFVQGRLIAFELQSQPPAGSADAPPDAAADAGHPPGQP